MIWVGGRIVPDGALAINALDRTFEHGLGLFETFRTWDGRPTLMGRHLRRLTRSANALRIPLDPAALPNEESVAALVRAEGLEGDAMLRITLTGGLTESRGETLWMRASALPPPIRKGGAVIDYGSWRVTHDDLMARFKTLNYWGRRFAYERARELGYDEVLSMSAGEERYLLEGSRTNLFLVFESSLLTPSAESGPMVQGVMREVVSVLANRLSMAVHTDPVRRVDLAAAKEVFLTNSVRGIIPVARAGELHWEAPGPWTQRLSLLLSDWLRNEVQHL